MSPHDLPISLPDYARAATQVLDANACAYFDGGAGDEATLAENGNAWRALRLVPRVLRQLAGGSTRCRLLGRDLRHPILLAPVAYQRLAHPDGEIASACAASAQGAGIVLSSQASVPLETVAAAIGDDRDRGPLWFQLYLQHDDGFNRELVQRVECAGFDALVLTVDAPCSGVRDRERRAEFRLPEGVAAVNLAGLPPRPPAPADNALCGGLLRHAPCWDDVSRLAGWTRLPLILKGILHPADARRAIEHGAAGVVVSNHGGRVLDTAIATAHALPAIAEVLDRRIAVLVDGGIRRGTDVVKALALGADAVMIGRPQVHGLAVAGAQGVAHVIRLLRDELEVAMALCGCATIAEIDTDVLARGLP
ncbi:MAG: alpha-hydroxy-acid oxidizing protein [Rhodocyclaceae bacterium]|nr:alpha-hydroxy-acid oxidizing protein [Rhodocyclaceae bacterium]